MEQVYCDPLQRLVADCILMDIDTAVVSDRKGSIAVLSWSNYLEGLHEIIAQNISRQGSVIFSPENTCSFKKHSVMLIS